MPSAAPALAIRLSHAAASDGARQAACEAALRLAARAGAASLHVSALAGDVLSLGAFHREPRGGAAGERWRRWTGGGAIASGAGFRIVTLLLPHRSALAAAHATDLRPEQALNRCVRGVLAGLRRLGVDALYPGLDAITVGGRVLARLGLAEWADGGALFQAVLAWSESFACTPRLLDRLDPDGRVPMKLVAAHAFTTVQEVRGGAAPEPLEAPADAMGHGYAEVFGAAIEPGAAADGRAGDAPPVTPDPPPGAGTATAEGRIGPVSAWVLRDGGRIARAGLSGDFLAPHALPEELAHRLAGREASRAGIAAALAGWLDGRERWLLGLRGAELEELLATAAAAGPPVGHHGPGHDGLGHGRS